MQPTHDTTPRVGEALIDADGMTVEPVELMGVDGKNGLYVKINGGAELYWPRTRWDQWAANARRVNQ